MNNFSDNDTDIQTDNVHNNYERKSSNILATLLLVFAIVVVALYAYLKSQDSDFSSLGFDKIFSTGSAEKEKENAFSVIGEIPYDSNENSVFAIYKDFIVKAGSDGIKFWDKKGNEVWNDSVTMSKPILKTNGTDLVAADMAGLDFVVLSGKAEKWRGRADGNIINADISNSGYVTILSRAKRYGGEATVYDSYGIEKFKAFIANNFPLVSKVSPSSREMIVNCINTSGAKVQTYMKLYDTGREEALAGNVLEPLNCIYPVIWYAGDDSIYLAGDMAITLLDKSGEQKWIKQYDTVYSTCMAGSRNLAAAVKEKTGTEIKIIATNGNELAAAPIDSEVRNLSSFGNIIAVNTVREVHFINDRGTALGKYTSKADISDVYFINRHEAVVISKSSVKVINIK